MLGGSADEKRNEPAENAASRDGRQFADETKKNKELIAVVDESGKPQEIVVPTGMMGDIVKPLWGERVSVIAVRGKDGKLSLNEIEPAATDDENLGDGSLNEPATDESVLG